MKKRDWLDWFLTRHPIIVLAALWLLGMGLLLVVVAVAWWVVH